MKIFLDANILVAVLNKEYPLFSKAARILSLTENRRFEVYTSPLCLAIAFYFSSKKSGEELARQKIAMLAQQLSISGTGEQVVRKATQNKAIHDFEYGLQYYSAVDAGCEVIVTENVEDFYFSEIAVKNSDDFLKEYLFRP